MKFGQFMSYYKNKNKNKNKQKKKIPKNFCKNFELKTGSRPPCVCKEFSTTSTRK